MFLGEIVTGWVWTPPGDSSIAAALTVANYSEGILVIKYPVIPWLAISVLGWVFGRYLIRFAAGQSQVSGRNVLWGCGIASLIVFAVFRGMRVYGDMFLPDQTTPGSNGSTSANTRHRLPTIHWNSASCSSALLCSGRSNCASESAKTARFMSSDKPRCSSTSSIASHSKYPQRILASATSTV
jgi:hypothetical protein